MCDISMILIYLQEYDNGICDKLIWNKELTIGFNDYI